MNRTLRALALFAAGCVAVAIAYVPSVRLQDVALLSRSAKTSQASSDIVVVPISAKYLAEAEGSPMIWESLVSLLVYNKPASLYLEAGVLDRASSDFSPEDVAELSVFLGDVKSVDEAVARVFGNGGLHRFVVAFDGATTGQSVGIPVMDVAFPSVVVSSGATATGVMPTELAGAGMGKVLVPIGVVPDAAPRRNVLLPSAALLMANGYPTGRDPELQVEGGLARIGGLEVRVEDTVGLRVAYARALLPRGPQVVDALDLVRGTVRPKDLVGKRVFIGLGPDASRRLKTPDGTSMSPVFVAANATNTIDSRQFVRVVPSWCLALIGVLSAAGAAFLWVRCRWWVAAAGSALALAGWFIAARTLYAHGAATTLIGVFGVVAFVSAAAIALAVLAEVRRRRHVADLFARYVPARVAERLLAGDLADQLAAGRHYIATALFVDLRGFTPMAERLQPGDVRIVLDQYYEYVTDRILAEDGTVIGFAGDEVYAVFGAPLVRDDHAVVGLDVAERIQDDVEQLNARLAESGLPTVQFGIGVHAGPVIAAHTGSHLRRQYAVLGETVNIASRCCSAADVGQIVATADTMEGSLRSGFEDAGEFPLKGLAGPRRLFKRGAGPVRLSPV